MRKNKMMRAASGLLVATLLTTSVISGTFAKYTTSASAQDSARVAKWGVTVTAKGDDAFAKEYDGDAEGLQSGTKTVVSATNTDVSTTQDKVVAPGTKGTLLNYEIKGTPEVMVNINATATLTLTGWEINGNETYCPIIFKVTRGNNAVTEYKLGSQKDETNHVYDSVADLKAALEKTITEMSEKKTAANQNLYDSITVTWEWPFEAGTTGNSNSYQTDAKDTALGNLSTAPTIKMESSVIVEQVD